MNTVKLRAIGGSISVTLPRQMVRQMGLEAGHAVEITSDGQCLVLAPARKHYSLAELLKGMKLGDMPTAPGWDMEPRRGTEIW